MIIKESLSRNGGAFFICIFFIFLRMLNPERKGSFVRMLRIGAAALTLMLAVGAAGDARGEIAPRRRMETPALYRRKAEGLGGNWWGVLYEDALHIARAEADEEKPNEKKAAPEDGPEVVFVWPLWDWLLRFLGVI